MEGGYLCEPGSRCGPGTWHHVQDTLRPDQVLLLEYFLAASDVFSHPVTWLALHLNGGGWGGHLYEADMLPGQEVVPESD